MSRLHLSLLCLATAGLMLAGCGDNEKRVAGPAMDGVSEGAAQTADMFASLAARKAAGVHPFLESAEGSGVAGKISTALATVGAGPTKVLLLVDANTAGTTALVQALAAAGYAVTVRPPPEYTWDGTNPSLDDFNCVIHLDGATYHLPLPVSGQTALEAFVQNGGGYITSQWSGYERAVGLQTAMNNLILQLWPRPDNCGGCNMTWTTVAGQESHPVLAGIPSPFGFFADGHDAGNKVVFEENPSTVLMRSPGGGPAVLVREFGSGHVVNFSHAANYRTGLTLQDPTIQKLYVNSVAWACGASHVVDTTAPAITLNGPANLTLECHAGTYTDQGATATDDVDGAVEVSVSGSVNTTVEGDYTITYTATDAAGNTATATRTVHVVDTTAPVLTLTMSSTSLWPPNHNMVRWPPSPQWMPATRR